MTRETSSAPARVGRDPAVARRQYGAILRGQFKQTVVGGEAVRMVEADRPLKKG